LRPKSKMENNHLFAKKISWPAHDHRFGTQITAVL
jgi:hypothetical protein